MVSKASVPMEKMQHDEAIMSIRGKKERSYQRKVTEEKKAAIATRRKGKSRECGFGTIDGTSRSKE